ncbi:MAG: DNA polymerase I [Gammaproteobacteria bacterium]|nr:DNA polymerase I [Gammaproteobacteria bacterium]MDH5801564.1 DNA polymerase I [Gammaproteobacteria bacterium]
MQKSSPIILVDGSSYLYRAFHAMPSLNNSKGQHTGAVYGVINMLRRLLQDYQPQYMAVVFDAKGKTFRNDIYPEYKANRPPMPDELRAQIEPLNRVIQAMGLPLISISGVEADDVIGTLATEAEKWKKNTLISTGDKDMAQLVNPHVMLINTMSNTLMDRKGVKEKFGIGPDLIVDYLALMGDTSDNIPGVPKVGPKTAVKWLLEYGSLVNIMTHADQVKGKVGENLRASLEQLPMSKELATIKCDLELDLNLDDLAIQKPDTETLKSMFAELEFKTWLSGLLHPGDRNSPTRTSNTPKQSDAPKVSKIDYQTLFTQQQLDTWIEKLQQAKLFAVDTETTDLDYMLAQIVGISFSITPGEAAYIPMGHDYPDAPAQLSRESVLAQLKPLLEDARQAKVGQNLKYDLSVLANYGIQLKGIAHDTMLQSYVLDSTATRHDMDSLALKFLGHKTIHFEDIAGKGKNQLTFDQIPVDKAAPYAAEDADITLRLHQTLWPRLQQQKAMANLYRDVEIPLIEVLSQVERNGVLINSEMLAKQSAELENRMAELEQEAFEIAGEEFNLGSTKQIQTILYDKMKLPVLKKTPKKQPSTAEPVLQELALDFPLPKLILDYRSVSKLKSTYTDKLPLQINPNTGRVHTSYHQAVASTGRLSSADPNLQNIPIRTQEGRRIRQAFVAAKGNKIVAADYSQIELRIMAHLSGDETLLQAFADNQDVHTATAAEVFGVSIAAVSQEERRRAKAINFGLIYGMSAEGLRKQLGISRSEAQHYINTYFARYPGVKSFMDTTRMEAHDKAYVETLFGRRLYLPDIKSSNGMRRQAAERTAINAPMQGTAADIIKMAMIKTHDWLRSSDSNIKMIMQVHDELVFEIPETEVSTAVEKINHTMSSVTQLRIPLQVDVGIGNNWDEAH